MQNPGIVILIMRINIMHLPVTVYDDIRYTVADCNNNNDDDGRYTTQTQSTNYSDILFIIYHLDSK